MDMSIDKDCGRDMTIEELQVSELREAIVRLTRDSPVPSDDWRFARKAMGMQGRELAGALDVAPETVSRVECGKMQPSKLYRLAMIYLLRMFLDQVQ